MTLKALFICNICHKQEIFSGPGATELMVRAPWKPIPIENRNAMKNKYMEFDPYEYEWLCSNKCMDLWVNLDPEKRIVFEESGYLSKDKFEQFPCFILKLTQDRVLLSLNNICCNLSDGSNVGGAAIGSYKLRLREKDRLRLINFQPSTKAVDIKK